MKWIYIAAGIAFYIKMIILSPALEFEELPIVDLIVEDTGIPNAVSGILFRNRLFDTIFEVVVFTMAIMGVQFLLSNEKPSRTIYQFSDHPSIILAQLGATIAALISIELTISGHLSPGGGFAAGVIGGTAIGLITVTSSSQWIEFLYQRFRAALWEKVLVLNFIIVAAFTLVGLELPHGEYGTIFSGSWIPILNILVAMKVALGSWTAVLVFILYRGLL